MSATLILAGLAVVFGVVTGLDRRKHGGGPLTPKQRTWLIVAGIFAAVSVYLGISGTG